MSDKFRSRIETALAEHDATLARCPVNNPRRGKVLRPDDACPLCHALASGTCGISSGAGYHLANAVRSALASVDRSGEAGETALAGSTVGESAVPNEDSADAQPLSGVPHD
jgi:hypothetical protein